MLGWLDYIVMVGSILIAVFLIAGLVREIVREGFFRN
jgi:hypothetical protein